MCNGDRERICSIVRRDGRERQKGAHHHGDLGFLGAAVARDGPFHACGRIFADDEPCARAHEQRDTARMERREIRLLARLGFADPYKVK